MALQESVLFSGTIRDNIRYGRPDASDDEVIAAAKLAQAHDFIMTLPDGYDAAGRPARGQPVGRAEAAPRHRPRAAHRPAILILDDSTSAVDVETEARIQEALAELRRGRTTFVIAQRISTVLTADKILVLDDGQVAAAGDHRTLLASSPIYREIYASQLEPDLLPRGRRRARTRPRPTAQTPGRCSMAEPGKRGSRRHGRCRR